MSYLVLPVDGESAVWSAEAVRSSAADLAGADAVQAWDLADGPYDLVLSITPAEGTAFSVRRSSSGHALSTDGTLPQAAEVAAWARRLLPAALPSEVWLVDQAYTEHAVLPAGISPQEVLDNWQELQD